jgi:hypothetical protein
LDEAQGIFATNSLDNIIGRCAQEFSDDGKLVNMILSREKWFSFQHFGENATSTPNINLDIILLPCKHDFGSSVVSGGDITSHLWILNTGKTEIANLQVTVFVDEDVGGFEITMNDTCRVNVFEATLDELAMDLEGLMGKLTNI